MAKFSKQSEIKLKELHTDLQSILSEAIKIFDFTILCGYRGQEEQEKAFLNGNSKAHFGQSKHNFKPSLAVDIAPYPIDWNNVERFKNLADIILKIANEKNIKLIWGGNWQKLKDYPHFELQK